MTQADIENQPQDSGKSLKDEIFQLESQRKALEAEVKASMDFLEATPVGLYKPLVDAEGYPRSDCDLYAVRQARQTVHTKTNDLKKISAEIYDKLGQIHETNREEAQRQMARDDEILRMKASKTSADMAERRKQIESISLKDPFLEVANVATGSPAYDGGLRKGHWIIQFGHIDKAVFKEKGLKELAAYTMAQEGKLTSIWIKDSSNADADASEIFIVPQKWPGSGLLGSSFDPIN